jgi:hypothetical protein
MPKYTLSRAFLAASIFLIGAGCPTAPPPVAIPDAPVIEEKPAPAVPEAGSDKTGIKPAPKLSAEPGVSLPANFPKDFPLMPEFYLMGVTSRELPRPTAGYAYLTANFEINDVSPSDVADFYERSLALYDQTKPLSGTAWLRLETKEDGVSSRFDITRVESGSLNRNKNGKVSATLIGNRVYVTVELGAKK